MGKRKEEHRKIRLPESELEVMQAVWDSEQPVSRARLEELMAERHPIAQTTLLTQLSRLAGKGFVRIEKAGRGSVYTALVSRGEYLSDQSRVFLDRLCGGSLSVFAAALCDSGLTKEELDELRKLLERSGK